jgi:hypothetical protein
LTFPNPGAVTAVSFEVTVNKIAVTSCASNSGFEAAAAEFRGGFFNTQNSPTSSIGDVLGDISVVRNVQDLGNALTGAGFISECTDQFCGAQTTLVYQVLGNVNAGSTNVLSIRWDQRNHQFIFRLNHNSPVYAPYNVADISPPFSASKTIGLARVVTHCTSSPRPYALVDAHFDNVYVNP